MPAMTVAGIPSMNKMLYMNALGSISSSAIDWLHIGHAWAAAANSNRPHWAAHDNAKIFKFRRIIGLSTAVTQPASGTG